MCAACTDERGAPLKQGRAKRERLGAMKLTDWTALLLASLVIAFGVFGELRDAIQSCKTCGVAEPVPEEDQSAAAANLITAALPLSLFYVLIDKFGAITADLTPVLTEVSQDLQPIIESSESLGI